MEFFNALRVSRDDLTAIGFDATHLSDFEMEDIARDLGGNEYIMSGFWDILRLIAEDREIPVMFRPETVNAEDVGWEG